LIQTIRWLLLLLHLLLLLLMLMIRRVCLPHFLAVLWRVTGFKFWVQGFRVSGLGLTLELCCSTHPFDTIKTCMQVM
jgi:hypothetical protein